MATKTIPFDLETAKKIQSREIEGKIKTKSNFNVRIVAFDMDNESYPIVAIIRDTAAKNPEYSLNYTKNGYRYNSRIRTLDDLILEVPDDKSQNFIDSELLFDKWDYIQNALTKLFKEKALKNNVKISDNDLIHYAAEFFTWLRETHLIFNFQWDKLEELNKYVKEHIMDPSWSNEVRHNIKQIFGIEIKKHEFKPFDKVLVRDGTSVWQAGFYSHSETIKDNNYYITTAGDLYLEEEIIPYVGNESLVGTTDKSKET